MVFVFWLFSLPLLTLASDHPLLLVISLDGFRYDYFSRVQTPTLNSLMDHGVYAPRIKNVFPTKTLPNHYSISTGLYAESHGLVGNTIYDPDLGKSMFGFNDSDVLTKNTMGDPIWILNEKKGDGRHTASMMWPVAHMEKDSINISNSQIYNRSMPWDERLRFVMKWFTDKDTPANLMMLYFPEPDHTGHQKGPESKEVEEVIERLDRALGSLTNMLEEENIFQRLNIIVTSDHGMYSSPEDKVIKLWQILSPDTFDYYGGSPVLMVEPKTGNEIDVYKKLTESAKENHFKVYEKEEIPEEWHLKHNRRVQKLLVIAELGYQFQVNKSDSIKKGNHGWNNSIPEMNPFFIGYGPVFKQGYRTDILFENIDLYPLMCHILGLKPGPHNGSLSRVSDLLINPPSRFYAFITDKWVIGGLIALVLLITVIITTVCLICYNKKKTGARSAESVISSYVYRMQAMGREGEEDSDDDDDTEEKKHLLLPAKDDDLDL